ncbi:MAG: hypothetical protein M2R45_02323 [Verrucomicrobia subdivision 3 bacterium]|nr:hypothetical protein [Limisphaerales bacterium]MCS1414702.1 hypothetical protein [Limisphaerales bacterium]
MERDGRAALARILWKESPGYGDRRAKQRTSILLCYAVEDGGLRGLSSLLLDWITQFTVGLACVFELAGYFRRMLLFRAKVSPDWFDKVRSNIASVLLDHAHLERRAATTALTLERYRDLYDRVEELNAIAIEELEHFQLVMNLLRRRKIPFGPALPSPWISGMMRSIRSGRQEQVIDHLLCCSLIEGRSCEKFQFLAEGFRESDLELAEFYGSLVEAEGNHYSVYLLMARQIDERETDRRLDYYLDLDAELVKTPNPRAVLH